MNYEIFTRFTKFLDKNDVKISKEYFKRLLSLKSFNARIEDLIQLIENYFPEYGSNSEFREEWINYLIKYSDDFLMTGSLIEIITKMPLPYQTDRVSSILSEPVYAKRKSLIRAAVIIPKQEEDLFQYVMDISDKNVQQRFVTILENQLNSEIFNNKNKILRLSESRLSRKLPEMENLIIKRAKEIVEDAIEHFLKDSGYQSFKYLISCQDRFEKILNSFNKDISSVELPIIPEDYSKKLTQNH